MNKKRASSAIFTIFFFTIFLMFCALAVDGTIVFANRSRLQSATEAAALAGASEFVKLNTVDAVKTAAENSFNLIKYKGLSNASITVSVNTDPNIKQVLVVATSVSQPFFLSFLGINGINIEAKACAVSEELHVTAVYPRINWLTAQAQYTSDILSRDLNLNDTAILLPVGDLPSASYQSNIVDWKLINNETTNQPLSLGPGGFITIKLPAPIINKPGPDLFIKETGLSSTGADGATLEGYMVFAGLDNNPAKPYWYFDSPGDGISWVNISKTGKPENSSFHEYIQTANGANITGDNVKFYGSGYFDLDGLGNISMVKYIRIVDDNSESAFVTNDGIQYYKAMLLGESSSATAGADIDYVSVLNHVRLMPPKNYVH